MQTVRCGLSVCVVPKRNRRRTGGEDLNENQSEMQAYMTVDRQVGAGSNATGPVSISRRTSIAAAEFATPATGEAQAFPSGENVDAESLDKIIKVTSADGKGIAPKSKGIEHRAASAAGFLGKDMKVSTADGKIFLHTRKENETCAASAPSAADLFPNKRTKLTTGKVLVHTRKKYEAFAATAHYATDLLPNKRTKITNRKVIVHARKGYETLAAIAHSVTDLLNKNTKIANGKVFIFTSKANAGSETGSAGGANNNMKTQSTELRRCIFSDKQHHKAASFTDTTGPVIKNITSLTTAGKDVASTRKESETYIPCEIVDDTRNQKRYVECATDENGDNFPSKSGNSSSALDAGVEENFRSKSGNSCSSVLGAEIDCPKRKHPNSFEPQSVKSAKVGYSDSRKSTTTRGEDSFDIFGQSVSAQLKMLPKRHAYATQLKIQSILTDVLTSHGDLET